MVFNREAIKLQHCWEQVLEAVVHEKGSWPSGHSPTLGGTDPFPPGPAWNRRRRFTFCFWSHSLEGRAWGAQSAEDTEGIKATVAVLGWLHEGQFFRHALTGILNWSIPQNTCWHSLLYIVCYLELSCVRFTSGYMREELELLLEIFIYNKYFLLFCSEWPLSHCGISSIKNMVFGIQDLLYLSFHMLRVKHMLYFIFKN